MSNRSLIEVNHDIWHRIEKQPEAFARDLTAYLGSASQENAEQLSRYGLRVFGMRHHSEGFNIKWGWHTASEKPTGAGK